MAHSIYNTADELVGGGERMREAERDGILRVKPGQSAGQGLNAGCYNQ